MAAVQSLCSRAIYLQEGKIRANGAVESVMTQYLQDTVGFHSHGFDEPKSLGPNLTLLAFDLEPNRIASGDAMAFTVRLRAEMPTMIHDLEVLIYSSQNVRLAIVDLRCVGIPVGLRAGEEWSVEGSIRSVPFVEGDYSAGLFVSASEYMENLLELTGFSIGAQVSDRGYAPVPLVYRGIVELDCALTLLPPGGPRQGPGGEMLETEWDPAVRQSITEHDQGSRRDAETARSNTNDQPR
ncbi:MAG: hypothetical protein H0U23_10350 [Blastocatellia bacterium]|nr:hypothetical protein [Blastocatellia bacterium]